MRDLKRAFTGSYIWIYVLCAFGFGITIAASAAPYRPSSDAQIVETLPKGSLTFQSRPIIQKNAKAPFGKIEPQVKALLAQAYALGDPRALGQAEALMQPYHQDTSPQLRLIRANMYQASHQFDDARRELKAILKQIPNQPDSVLMLSSIDLVQGHFAAARQTCNQLTDMGLLVLRMGCIAQVDSMTGKLKQSAATVKQLMQLNHGLTIEQQRWLGLILADMALRLNDAQLAELAFSQLDQSSAPALMAKADWLLAHQQWVAVKQLLAAHSDNDSLLLRLLISEQHLKDPNASLHFKLLGDRIRVWQERGEIAHQREAAQYALLTINSGQALTLARLNWQKQRETADVLVYSNAALRNKSQADIKIIQDWITKTGFEYPQLSKVLAQAGRAS